MTNEQVQNIDEETSGSPLGTIGLGIGALLMAGGLFYWFLQFEASGATRGAKMWWPIALAYNIGGKWPPSIVIGLVGIAGIALGVREMIAKKS